MAEKTEEQPATAPETAPDADATPTVHEITAAAVMDQVYQLAARLSLLEASLRAAGILAAEPPPAADPQAETAG